jgi:alpha-glucuronidase
MKSGRTLWDEICVRYDTGIQTVEGFRKTWQELKPYVAPALWEETDRKLTIQANDGRWWRDACVGYFQTFSGRPLPAGVEPLKTPIDSLIYRSIQSDRLGMPQHNEAGEPIIVAPRRFRRQ